MKDIISVNIPMLFLQKPYLFGLRNVEEYRIFLESYCIGKGFDYNFFKTKFTEYIIESKKYIFENYHDWVSIIRLESSNNDRLSLDLLKSELEGFLEQKIDDRIKLIFTHLH
jgi:hypothetical protein